MAKLSAKDKDLIKRVATNVREAILQQLDVVYGADAAARMATAAEKAFKKAVDTEIAGK